VPLDTRHLRERSSASAELGTIALAGPITVEALRDHIDGPPRELPRGLGGVPVTVLADELLARGHRLVVTTLSRDVTDEVLITGPNLRLHIAPFRDRGRARDGFRHERGAVTRALRRERPDVVHAHWSYEYALGALRSGSPTLVTLHDWAPTIFGFHRDPYRAVRVGMNAATLARGRHFSTVSPYIGRAVARWGRRATIVPNGLADHWFDGRARRRRPHAPVLVSVSSGFDVLKNGATLLRAFAHLREQHPTAELQLIGGGYRLGGPAHDWAAAQDLHEGVDFRGKLPYPETMEAVGAADLLVHPSREESFGMTLIEAMAQGTPVIGGADSGAVPWVLDGGRAGELADVTSSQALTAAMDRLLTDDGRWQELSARGYEHAWTSYRLGPIADRYLALYGAL